MANGAAAALSHITRLRTLRAVRNVTIKSVKWPGIKPHFRYVFKAAGPRPGFISLVSMISTDPRHVLSLQPA
jgi:hypothetical protein